MDRIDNLLKEELLKQNNKIFLVILYACGGVMFLRHFYKLIGKQDKKLLQRLIDAKLIKTKRLGKSQIVIAKYAVYQHFELDNKTIVLTSKRILHSALVAEILIHTYSNDLIRIEKMLKAGNFSFFSPCDSLNFLNRIYSFMELKKCYDLTVIQASIKEHEKKVKFFEGSRRGKRDKLEKDNFQSEDLFTLKSKDIYMRYADYKDDTLRIYVAFLVSGKGTNKIVDAINKCEKALEYMFDGINIKIYFDIYSLDEKSTSIENRVKESLLKIKGNELKEDYYNDAITFHWYNSRKILFSGIDIGKWL